MKGIVGKNILAQLVGSSGPISLGTFDSYEVTPDFDVNERKLMDGTVESEAVGANPWQIKIARAKRDYAIDSLLDAASDPNTAPSLQLVETVTYPDGQIRQYLYSSITVRGGGTSVDRKVDETIELAADKRQVI